MVWCTLSLLFVLKQWSIASVRLPPTLKVKPTTSLHSVVAVLTLVSVVEFSRRLVSVALARPHSRRKRPE